MNIVPEQVHGAKAHAAIRVTYVIPRNWRGSVFWFLLGVILRIGGAR